MGGNEVTQVNRKKMYKWIMSVLATGESMTAREVAIELHKQGYIPLAIRQATAPRLTELEHMGLVCVTGNKIDEESKKRVRKYEVIEGE